MPVVPVGGLDEDEARRRFRIAPEGGEAIGVCLTRTGRRFFDDERLERALLARVCDALDSSGLWERLATGWVCLDAELMPWSVKARELIRDQYAAVGAASRSALADVLPALDAAAGRGVALGDLLPHARERASLVQRYREAYRRYCWPVRSVDDLTGRNSQLRLGAQGLIAELTVTARSFRGLADELERHPESLVRGKQGGGY